MATAKKVTKEDLKEEVKEVKSKETAKAAETAKAEPVKAEPAKEAAKPAKKAPAKKAAAKKTTTKKTAAKAAESKTDAKTAKRTSAAVKSPSIFIQHQGKEVSQEDLINKIVDKWCAEEGKKASSIKELNIYIKPEDNAAYYVINGQGSSVGLL